VSEEGKELARIARLQRVIWLWLLTFLPALILAAWLAPDSGAVIIAIAITWTIGLAIAVVRASAMLCPRCGMRFHGERLFPRGQACASCGLRLKQAHIVYPTLE
jgi:hypothetical protein